MRPKFYNFENHARLRAMDTIKAAIFVDYDLYSHEDDVQNWVNEREDDHKIVFLVYNPLVNDYNEKFFTDSDDDEPLNHIVVRNSAYRPMLTFKRHAVDTMLNVTDLLPVVAIDSNARIRSMYAGFGFTVVFDETLLADL